MLDYWCVDATAVIVAAFYVVIYAGALTQPLSVYTG